MRTAKLILLLLGFYIAAGVITYPRWWYHVVSSGGLRDFLDEALGPFFYYNLAVAVALAVVAFFHHAGEARQAPWTGKVNAAVDSKFLVGGIWGLLFLGVSRALFVGIDSYTHAAPRVVQSSQPNVAVPLVALPIELVFVDRVRLADTFGQIQGELRLTEQKISQKDSAEAEGGGNFGAATIRGKKAKEGESSSTFAAVEPNDPVKIVKTIEYLSQQGRLLTVRSVELQSKELKEFEAAVDLLSIKHSIALPKGPIDERRRSLIEQNLKQAAPKEFAIGSWVLIDGKSQLATSGKTAALRFEYVPSLPSRVSFSCSVPTSDLKLPTSSTAKEIQNLQLRIFAKIASSDGPSNQIQYGLSCYAAFR